jgi:protein-arginine kinase activator protein McsA
VASLRELAEEIRKNNQYSPSLSPLDKLKSEMNQAIESEQYERAAELRDAIRKMKNQNLA